MDAEDDPAYPQHCPAVLLHDLLERLLHHRALPHREDAPSMPNVRSQEKETARVAA
jgi:hypothetical protein